MTTEDRARASSIASGSPRPAVSVVIPTCDGSNFLLETLQSVFDQTFADIEVIVVDDGSTDDTPAVLAPLVGAGRIRLIRQANTGTAAARRHGVAASRGELVALLDHDDLWPEDKLAWQVAALRDDADAVLVYGTMRSFGLERSFEWPPPDGPTGWVRPAFLRKNWIRSPGQTLIRRSALERVGGFDPTVCGADDWDLYLKLAAIGRFVYRNRPALHYRAHAGNRSKRAWQLFRQGSRVHGRHAGPLPGAALELRWWLCRASLANLLLSDLRARRRAEALAASPRGAAVGLGHRGL